MQTEAVAIIRACIDGVRWSTESAHLSEHETTAAKAASEQFAHDVQAWLGAVRRASERRWRPSEAWHLAFRQHLSLVVGPAARSELGRAADHAGYQLLAHEFRILFGDYAPLAPSLSGPEVTDQDRGDAELAAAFHTLPESLRHGTGAVTRLLGIAVQLAARHRLDEAASQQLTVLNQMREQHS